MIELINRELNAVELNVTDDGFPAWLEGFKPWKVVYEQSIAAQAAFANVVVLDPEGKYLLASGDNGKFGRTAKDFSMNYDPPRFIKILELALERNKRLEALRSDTTLTAEARATGIASLSAEVDADLERLFKSETYFLSVVRNVRKQQAATP